MRFVVLIGVVSLFADMTYEGSRSIVGPYLALLGASGAMVGIVAGGGELLGYTLRIVSGRLSDATGRYWPITIIGYVLQMAAVPTLALAGSWQVAAGLIVLERVGKAIRNPPRDTMLAHASSEMGRGWGFGVHEALDQLGALLGPLAAAAVLAIRGDYGLAFLMLGVPAALTLLTLLVARVSFPNPLPARAAPDTGLAPYPRRFWLYAAAAALVAAGFADFSLMAFHFAQAGTVPGPWVAIFYSAAMAASGTGSLLFGRLYDRIGIAVLLPVTLVTALYAPLSFLGAAPLALLGVALWGIGMGVHESIMAAAVAEMVPSARLASAYGTFTLVYGLAWFAGSAVMGLLYDLSVPILVAFSIAVELAAIPILARLRARPPDGLGSAA
jgi:MFS family permease